MLGTIDIRNEANAPAEINIEGVIGIPEWYQFEDDSDRVATYAKFSAKVDEIKAIKASSLIVNIRSLGGGTQDAFLIHDAITDLGVPVTTRCFGYVASAATIVAQAASPGKRLMSENSLYLTHQAWGYTCGNSERLMQFVYQLKKMDDMIASLYAKRSGGRKKFFRLLMAENSGEGVFLSAKETLEAGLIDEIMSASAAPAYSSAKNLAALTSLENNLKPMNMNKTFASVIEKIKAMCVAPDEVEDTAAEAPVEETPEVNNQAEEPEPEDLEDLEAAEDAYEDALEAMNAITDALNSIVERLDRHDAAVKAVQTDVKKLQASAHTPNAGSPAKPSTESVKNESRTAADIKAEIKARREETKKH